METIWKLLIGAGLGFGIAKIIEPTKKKSESKSDKYSNQYWISLRSEKFDTQTMYLYDFESAKKLFEKIKDSKEVVYKDLIEYSPLERKLYNQWVENKDPEKPKKSETSKVSEVSWGLGEKEFESKEF